MRFLNNVQLRIYTSLLLGNHDGAGRALAVYAAAIEVTRERLEADGTGSGLTEEQLARALEVLDEHLGYAQHTSPTLLGYGESHEFGSYMDAARETYRSLSEATRIAVEGFYDRAERHRPSTD